jgi:penicillin amidase
MIVGATAPLTVTDMQRMQFDSHSVFADDVMGFFGDLAVDDPVAQSALDAMRQWDRASTRTSAGAAVFEAFAVQLSRALFEDEVGPELAKEVLGAGSHAKTAIRNALADPAAPWWDDITTPERETREQIIERAFGQAVDELKTRQGNDVTSWQWGKLHTVVFPNQTLGKSGIGAIESIFNRGPFAAEGAPSAVNNTGGGSFAVTSGPSWRAVFDLSDWRNSVGIHTTGQSGHAYNAHYDDMIPLWLEGKHNPLLWSRGDVITNAEATLVLAP